MSEIESVYITAHYYASKSQAAKFLNIPTSTLQYHIGKGNIDTIHIPGMGHLISEWDILDFQEKLSEMKPGKPGIYKSNG